MGLILPSTSLQDPASIVPPCTAGMKDWHMPHICRRNGKTATMQNEDQPKHGRPSAYSDKIAEAICERLINGESLRAICADPRMPAKATVFRWLASNQEFRRSYALAPQYGLPPNSQSNPLAQSVHQLIPVPRLLFCLAVAIGFLFVAVGPSQIG